MSVRDYKFTFHFGGPPRDVYIHDNNDHELMDIPPIMSKEIAEERIEFMHFVTAYCRRYGITILKVDKV